MFDKVKKGQICLTSLFFLLVFILSCIFVSAASIETPKPDENRINSIRLSNSGKLYIEYSFTTEYLQTHEGQPLYLFELLPYQSENNLNDYAPTVSFALSSRNRYIEIDFTENSESRIYSRYVLAYHNGDAYQAVTHPHYIDNPEIFASAHFDYPKPLSKKGLVTMPATESELLDISHTIIDIPLNEFRLNEESENSFVYIHNGEKYYISKDKLDELDKSVTFFTYSGINIYLNIVLTQHEKSACPQNDILYFSTEASDSIVPDCYAVNLNSKESFDFVSGFLRFISQRYTEESGDNGFAGSFIIGKGVSAPLEYNYSEQTELNDYIDSYIKLFRVASTSLHSAYSNGKTYIPLCNNWNVPHTGIVTADSLSSCTSLGIIEAFDSNIEKSGHISYNIAFDASPTSKDNNEIWNDTRAEHSTGTSFITIKNISVLTDYFKNKTKDSAKNKDGYPSIMLLFSVNGEKQDELSAQKQAASYALAYYTAEFNDAIEAIVYTQHSDTEYSTEGLTDIYGNGKPIMRVFRKIDTHLSENVTKFALNIIGIADWKGYIPNYDKTKLTKRVVYDSANKKLNKTVFSQDITWFDFTTENKYNFKPDNALEISDKSFVDGESCLSVKLADNAMPSGVMCNLKAERNVSNITGMTLSLRCNTPEQVKNVTVILRFYNNQLQDYVTAAFSGETVVETNKWIEVPFVISDYSTQDDPNIDVIKIWVIPEEGTNADCSLDIRNITLLRTEDISALESVLLISVTFLLIGFCIIFTSGAIHFHNSHYTGIIMKNTHSKIFFLKKRTKNKSELQFPDKNNINRQ